MACFSIACNSGFLVGHHKLGFFSGKTKPLKRCELFAGNSSLPFTSISFIKFCEFQSGFLWKDNISSLVKHRTENVRFKQFGLCNCLKSHNGLACEDEENDNKPVRSENNGVDKQVYLGKRGVRRRFPLTHIASADVLLAYKSPSQDSLKSLIYGTKAEDLGLLSLIVKIAAVSPSVLASAALPVFIAAVLAVIVIPDDSIALVAAKAILAGALVVGAAGLFVGVNSGLELSEARSDFLH